MVHNPKKYFSKTKQRPTGPINDRPEGREVVITEVVEGVKPVNQDKIEKQNLERLKKSLKELILEKEGGAINSKKLKTFSLK